MSEERIVNGVNVDRLFNTMNAIKDTPGLARFRFRARNTWVNGGHNRTTITGFYGACQKHTLTVVGRRGGLLLHTAGGGFRLRQGQEGACSQARLRRRP